MDHPSVLPVANPNSDFGSLLPTRNDLPARVRSESVALLNARLADAIDLSMQAKQAHWNVKGPSFSSLHALFDVISTGVAGQVDLFAERAVQIGGMAMGTVRAASERSSLPEYPPGLLDGADHVSAVADVLARFSAAVRRAMELATEVGDADTADLFTQASREVDRLLWMVEAHASRG